MILSWPCRASSNDVPPFSAPGSIPGDIVKNLPGCFNLRLVLEPPRRALSIRGLRSAPGCDRKSASCVPHTLGHDGFRGCDSRDAPPEGSSALTDPDSLCPAGRPQRPVPRLTARAITSNKNAPRVDWPCPKTDAALARGALRRKTPGGDARRPEDRRSVVVGLLAPGKTRGDRFPAAFILPPASSFWIRRASGGLGRSPSRLSLLLRNEPFPPARRATGSFPPYERQSEPEGRAGRRPPEGDKGRDSHGRRRRPPPGVLFLLRGALVDPSGAGRGYCAPPPTRSDAATLVAPPVETS
ncbi:hypothetical protein THAOC_06717 [Thalassiosira oceanica]|uniref:Uncharacterized protein n=1 Tax=Thalassiosira oceanica TaxID=159749 RepID=K0TEB3_THAOC|nr:hypothetical protein THAOC_06717 [Thalassiosira oceanica]|eukprot:EJK71806.1 hypothetical protein THAOC_06717 [Thalassiosira oceanica]